jgi:hypothetical protein
VSEYAVVANGQLDLGLPESPAPASRAARPRPARPSTRSPRTSAAPSPEWSDDACPYDACPYADWPYADWVDDGWLPGDLGDPQRDPDDDAAWLGGLPADVRADYLAGAWTGEHEAIPAGFLHHLRSSPNGAGFSAGGALDALVPGCWLAEAITAAAAGGHDQLGESELIGVLCAWRRMSSWAAAGEAAAVIALARRRSAQAAQTGRMHLAEHVNDELAAALTLTGRSADRLLWMASGFVRLADVHAALERGHIDWAKACVFVTELAVLADDELARGIASRLLGRAGAGGWTTGQLRAALRRAVLAADPEASERRRADARKDAEVQTWHEPSGNAALAGRELPPSDVIAADSRLTALAHWLQSRGATGTISQLRAAVYAALLAGRPLDSLVPGAVAADADPADRGPNGRGLADGGRGAGGPGAGGPGAGGPGAGGPGAGGPGAGGRGAGGPGAGAGSGEAGSGEAVSAAAVSGAAGPAPADALGLPDAARGTTAWPSVAGTIHLTMPMLAWLGGGQPGEVAGRGPVDAQTSRELAAMLAASSATRWCLTLTGQDGRAVAHACAGCGPAAGQPVLSWAAGLRKKLKLLETGSCGHAHESACYQPPSTLRHLIMTRQRTCSFPGCRRPAVRCDLDHTVPFGEGGRTCECNLSPLCRRHHRAKQVPGWHLEQRRPGELTWRLPSGRSYQTAGEPYAA